jgi:hypothetical protein
MISASASLAAKKWSLLSNNKPAMLQIAIRIQIHMTSKRRGGHF